MQVVIPNLKVYVKGVSVLDRETFAFSNIGSKDFIFSVRIPVKSSRGFDGYTVRELTTEAELSYALKQGYTVEISERKQPLASASNTKETEEVPDLFKDL